jgi:3-phenylpropionate/trans-cinnamate dioxygenase ferredoxin component
MIRVCSLLELPPGEWLRLELSPAVTVFRTLEGEVFAVDDTCTHQYASLANGWLQDCAVECPVHSSLFDLRTGEPDGPPATRWLRTHQVSITDGVIYLTVSTESPAPLPDSVLPTRP